MAELFGFSFKKNAEKSRAPSPIQPSSDDGATSYIAGGYYGQYLDLDGNFKTEYDMVKKSVSYTHLTLPTNREV